MVVRMRHTRSHTRNRRSHHALTGAALSLCPECKASHLRHHACPSCGMYRGKKVLNVVKKIEKKEKKAKERTKAGQ